MQGISKVSSIRKAYKMFGELFEQLSVEEYLILLRESESEQEKRFYVELHNKMLADRQKEIINEKEFML